jgi:predicted regulator of Ras-like GTPase activity (Roadblock/LC7/MglB family)
MSNSNNNILQIITDLQADDPDIRAVSFTSTEGRIQESTLPKLLEKMKVSAVSAAAMAISRKGSSDLDLGNVEQVHIQSGNGSILLLGVSQGAVLTIVLRDNASVSNVVARAQSVVSRLTALV